MTLRAVGWLGASRVLSGISHSHHPHMYVVAITRRASVDVESNSCEVERARFFQDRWAHLYERLRGLKSWSVNKPHRFSFSSYFLYFHDRNGSLRLLFNGLSMPFWRNSTYMIHARIMDAKILACRMQGRVQGYVNTRRLIMMRKQETANSS
jgi:hypothetical protein